MTCPTFSRLFKKNTGHRFVDYLRKLRIGHACRLLSGTQLPVTRVCFESGYNNLSNFNRHFLREKRLTPTAYRRLAVKCLMENAGPPVAGS
jgi:transcriptional regulator GlxA family with amidase domain